MDYEVHFTPASMRELSKLPQTARQLVWPVIQALAQEPRPARQSKRLVNTRDLWRVKAGDYRVIYRIEEARLVVLLVRVAHRRQAYRHLSSLD